MNNLVCVNCGNEKPVNSTNNRLVTERCGHVKCMDCLLREQTGCSACLENNKQTEINDASSAEDYETANETAAGEPIVKEDDETIEVESEKIIKNISSYQFLTINKTKLETSHIKVETDGNTRHYICTLCDKKFHARSQVAYHAYCNGQRKPFQCTECAKTFASHSHFKYHMRVHRNERIYCCDLCNDSFFQMSKLQRHKLKHTNEKNHVCSECNKAFNNLTSLRKHALTHTEERPYTCDVCGRRFRDGSNYRKHMIKHEKVSACTCGSCQACEKEAQTGNTAKRTTRVIRTHQCPRCPRAFYSSKDMRRHAAVHTDLKPFWCKVCSRRFRRKDNLERHIRNTHPDQVTAAAVDCDQIALSEPIEPKTQRVSLDPPPQLPTLPDKFIQKHLNGDTDIDKLYILVANNARQSVIVGKRSPIAERQPSPECEYVHKIRRANTLASQKNIPLPPIDEKKILKLNELDSLGTLDMAPPKDRNKLIEMIMYEDGVKRDEEPSDPGPDDHWKRRKMKLNMN